MTISQYMAVPSKHLSKVTREQQIITAADFVLREVGAKKFTIDKVIEYLGIAKGTVYKYFKSKDDLLAEVSVQALRMLLNYFKLSQSESVQGLNKTKAIFFACYAFSKDHPEYFELLYYMERPEFKTEAINYKKTSTAITDFVINHLEAQKKDGFIKKQVDSNYASHVMWSSCMGIMQFLESKKNFIENAENLTQKEMMDTYVQIMVAGMAA